MGARAVGSRAARTPGSTRRDLNLFTMLLSHTLSLPLVVEGIFIFRNIPKNAAGRLILVSLL